MKYRIASLRPYKAAIRIRIVTDDRTIILLIAIRVLRFLSVGAMPFRSRHIRKPKLMSIEEKSFFGQAPSGRNLGAFKRDLPHLKEHDRRRGPNFFASGPSLSRCSLWDRFPYLGEAFTIDAEVPLAKVTKRREPNLVTAVAKPTR